MLLSRTDLRSLGCASTHAKQTSSHARVGRAHVAAVLVLLCMLSGCSAKQARPETAASSQTSAQRSMPCDLDAFRWRVVNPGGCSESEWLLTATGDGVYQVEEHGCENLSGTAKVVNGDVQISCASNESKLHYDLQTSTGQCESISGIYEHQPGGERTGSGPFEFVKLGPR